jgi:hypothetical protein
VHLQSATGARKLAAFVVKHGDFSSISTVSGLIYAVFASFLPVFGIYPSLLARILSISLKRPKMRVEVDGQQQKHLSSLLRRMAHGHALVSMTVPMQSVSDWL